MLLVPMTESKNIQNEKKTIDRELSPRQVAEAIGVSESSLKRWCDSGQIPTRRTAGGHRRIPINGLVSFLRRKGFDAKRPDLLGLPAGAHRDERAVRDVAPGFRRALVAGDADRVTSTLTGLYLAGHGTASLCDTLLAPTFREVGNEWKSGDVEIYQERRAVEIVQRALVQWQKLFPSPGEDAPIALSATLSGDPYTLPTAMIELVLREHGWQATALGPNHPAHTLRTAIDHLSPRLMCVDVSSIADEAAFVSEYTSLYEHARARDVAVAVGGRALSTALRTRIRYAAYCESMAELVGLAESLWRPPA